MNHLTWVMHAKRRSGVHKWLEMNHLTWVMHAKRLSGVHKWPEMNHLTWLMHVRSRGARRSAFLERLLQLSLDELAGLCAPLLRISVDKPNSLGVLAPPIVPVARVCWRPVRLQRILAFAATA